ncbi:MFS transporter [Marivirga sp. S37H4]|uniref:MFS transporter n=1 Tax=Marivirga aurantiaca TaxID=2802615 RepID=A0A934WV15_9BACT|nr:MFS transporter [Marivirga aurantiaca]MBK6263549.1 MFS transporter [Marivirga aurantiaca]
MTELKKNWRQFSLLVIVNAFVGAMIGLERTILPELAESEFGIKANTAIFSFIIVFGITKALTNYFAGAFANKIGRRNLLIIGWLFALPFPFILIYANDWSWIIFANILLGINQGLAWSSTVVMKIDLAGQKNRGLAMGLNESAGYLAVGLVAYFTAEIAGDYGVRPYPFYMGIAFAIIGLLLSIVFVKDTHHHVVKEAKSGKNEALIKNSSVFWNTTWKDKNLGSVTQAGLINNLNDGMMWGLLPVFLLGKGFELADVGKIVGIYPIVWGLGQLFTGKLSDILPKKPMLYTGMFLQGLSILAFLYVETFWAFAGLSFLLGLGTALVYPTFMAAIADYSNPIQRANAIGVFRLWRDMGYAVGALLTGILVDYFSEDISLLTISLLTLTSGFIIMIRMKNKK